jgi:hypothetical protein
MWGIGNGSVNREQCNNPSELSVSSLLSQLNCSGDGWQFFHQLLRRFGSGEQWLIGDLDVMMDLHRGM